VTDLATAEDLRERRPVSIPQTKIDAAATLLGEARNLVVLTGAGISTESGIPDFRSPGGLWTRYDPTKLTFDRFCASAETRRQYWEMGNELYPALRDAEPNAAHRVLAAFERRGGLLRIVTQNVDGLHQRAGSSAHAIIEIHGTALVVGCLTCGARQDRAGVQARFQAGEHDPRCECGGLLKPATISFGQAMPERETAQAFADAAAADVFLVVGSSLAVYPAAGLPKVAIDRGTPLLIVNREPTPYDRYAEVLLHTSAGPTLGAIAEQLGLPLA
jgi:NAD-dependent deacetylase